VSQFVKMQAWPIWFIGCVVAGFLAYAYQGAQGVPTQSHTDILKGLANIREQSAVVNQQLVQTRYRLNSSFDPLVKAVKGLQQAASHFEKGLLLLNQRQLTVQWEEFSSIFKQKRRLIERFKSQNAVLKNFLNHFSLAVQRAHHQANSGQPKLDPYLDDLLQATLVSSLNLTGQRFSWQEALSRLEKAAPKDPRPEIKAVIRHAQRINLLNSEMTGLTNKLLSLSLHKPVNRLFEEYDQYFVATQNRAKKFQILLALVSIGLLLGIGWFVFRLSRTSKDLTVAVDQLEFQKYALDQHAIVSIADQAGNITYVNDKFCEISEFSTEELEGQNHRIVRSEEHDDEFFQEMWETISSGRVWNGQIKNKKKQGGYYWVASTIVPFVNDKGLPFQYISIRTDITAQKDLERDIQDQRLFVEGITNSMGDGVYVLDKDGVCVFLNPEGQRQLGWTAEELASLNMHETVHPFDAKGCRRSQEDSPILNSVAKKQVFRSADEVFVPKSGDPFPVSVVAVPLIRNEKVEGIVAVFSDISERKKVEEAQLAAKEAAEAANRAKSFFLANMSHEIRTPMNAVIGMSYLAIQSEKDPTQRDYLMKIHQAGQSLLRVLNDILDFSKIEAGKLEIEHIGFRLDQVLEKLSSQVAIKAHEKRLELIFSWNPKIPINLIGDPSRLNQVLLNLVSNAIKFTESGEIEVRFDQIDSSEGSDRLMLDCSVRDTGIGISEEKIEKLFQAFTQADSSTSRRFGGTGLGLSIAANLVHLMGGEISATSTPGEGSGFRFTLEVVKSPDVKSMFDFPKKVAGQLVGLIEPNRRSREIFEGTLKNWGFTVVSADSFSTFEQLYLRPVPSLLVVDGEVILADSDKRLSTLKKTDEWAGVPVLVLGNHLNREKILTEIAFLEPCQSIQKPLCPGGSFQKVMELLHPEEMRHEEGPSTPGSGRLAGYRVLLVEDNEANRQIATELLMMCQIEVQTAENGLEAIEALKLHTFDLVLMDVQMPILDGYQATQRIREELMLEIPVIALTASAMEEDKHSAFVAGMNDFLSKPIEPQQLFQALERWLIGLESPVPLRSNAPLQLDGFDVSRTLQRTGGNWKVLSTLLRRFPAEHEETLDNLQGHVVRGEWEAALQLIHQLKGHSANLGAERVAQVARDLEKAIHAEQADMSGELAALQTEMDRACNSIQEADFGLDVSAGEQRLYVKEHFLADLQDLINAFSKRKPKDCQAAMARLSTFTEHPHEFELDRIEELSTAFRFNPAQEKAEALLLAIKG